MRALPIVAAVSISFIAVEARGQVIDFETTPGGGTPTDDAPLSASYIDGATTVTFGFDTDEDLGIDVDPRFEARGGGPTESEFAYFTGPDNDLAKDDDFTPGGVGGSWLIRMDSGSVDPKSGDDFVIVYSGTLPTSASGQVWDLDGGVSFGYERWRVDALNSSGQVIATQRSPFFTAATNPPIESLDGWPWTFSFEDLDSPISAIRISWIGTYGAGVMPRFGFDNFDATQPAVCDSPVIDFETTPSGGTPTDDALLSNAFAVGTATCTFVRFGYDTDDDLVIDANPHFEARGGGAGDSEFSYNTGPTDNLDHDLDLKGGGTGGAWLLREPVSVDPKVHDFLVAYSGVLPTSASGEIWDLDGSETDYERWRVDALDGSGQVIATQNSPYFMSKSNPPVGSLDGWPWTFSFEDLSSPIQTIRISWIGDSVWGVGLGFDNFSATQPASFVPSMGLTLRLILGFILVIIGARGLRALR